MQGGSTGTGTANGASVATAHTDETSATGTGVYQSSGKGPTIEAGFTGDVDATDTSGTTSKYCINRYVVHVLTKTIRLSRV